MLDGPTKPATGDKTKRLVILLHGYGSNGDDLIGLAPFFAQIDPNATFASPNAPQPSPFAPGAFQWFPIPYIDGSSPEEMASGMITAQAALSEYIDAQLAAQNLSHDALILVGFSQGTMMALEYALTAPNTVAGIIGFSGRLISVDDIDIRLKSKPPIALIHGTDDDVVGVEHSIAAHDKLRALDVDINLHQSPGTPHSIAQDGLVNAIEFYRNKVLGG